MSDNQQRHPFSIQSSLSEIAKLIESSKGAAALAEKMLWDIVHCHPEVIQPQGCHDLAVVAGNLSATGLQMRSHLEVVQSFVRGDRQ